MNARRGWVRAQERGRAAVARELAKLAHPAVPGHQDGRAVLLEGRGGRILDGEPLIDAHRAREHARSLVALEAEQAAFEDWTRAQGKVPENREPGAFVGPAREYSQRMSSTRAGAYSVDLVGHRLLVRFDASVTESEQVAHVLAVAMGEQFPDQGATSDGSTITFGRTRRGGWPGKLARQWGGDSRAPMGRAYAKLGRRILDALDGQPAWEWCYALTTGVRDRLAASGWAVGEWTWVGPVKIWPMSRHNLRGVLAPIEWSPQVRRRRTDQVISRVNTPDTWLDALGRMAPGSGVLKTVLTDGAELRRTETRVVLRGEHRDPGVYASPAFLLTLDKSDRPDLDERISSRAMFHEHLDSQGFEGHPTHRLPRWRRGELRHAEQRRSRELDRQIAAASLDVARAMMCCGRVGMREGIASMLECDVDVVTIVEHRDRGAVEVSVSGWYTAEQVMAAAIQFAPATVRVDVVLPATLETLTITGTITV